MKSYTDLEQSKKLAEILPIESADMYYWCGSDVRFGSYKAMDLDFDIPCWSLAALLNVIKKTVGYTMQGSNECFIACELGDEPWHISTKDYAHEIDASYEMIIKLHELNLL